jgi:hypothetical protein
VLLPLLLLPLLLLPLPLLPLPLLHLLPQAQALMIRRWS